ncbi:MAG: cell envelope integrity protein TolA [Hoeflea sp.]|uniref:cell envelope integrity protein TolA n=1 Tax=Hoeflea sp. TaxID=1940281 RepID=UPI003EF6684C
MKGSLATSTVLHALVLGVALSSFTAPRTLEVADVESFPVSIVPIEEITQIQQGEKTAPVAEKAAPTPTSRPDPVPDAQNAGDNSVDLKTSKAAKPSPKEVVSEAPPKPAEKPAPQPEPAPKTPAQEPVKVSEPKPAPEPKPEPAPKPAAEKPAEPKPAPVEIAALPAEPTPDPVAEAITEAAPAEPQFTALPSAGPVPEKRPEPQKIVAKAEAQEKTSTKESDFNADQVAALLNKQDAAGGGAKRTTETASLGGTQTTRGNTLSQSEMDALRGQIQKYWNIIPGMADGGDVRVTVRMRLDPAGNIIGEPDVSASGGSAGTRGTLSGSARRAVLRAQPYQLPKEKYDSWSDVIVNFDPSQMF